MKSAEFLLDESFFICKIKMYITLKKV